MNKTTEILLKNSSSFRVKRKKQRIGKIIIPVGMKPYPRKWEIAVAEVLATYFQKDVEFVPAAVRSTPDFLIGGIFWELKSPQGDGKNNIQRQLQYAARQSNNVIIDASRSKMHGEKIRREVARQFGLVKSVKRLIYISKDKKVLEFHR